MPTNVLIAGGGTAGLEAALRLHRVAADRVATTLIAPEGDFIHRPLSVLDPFAAGRATAYPLARIAADAGFTHKPATLARVDPAAHVATTRDGEPIPYDALLVAAGATPVRPFPRATVFSGSERDVELIHGLVQDVEGGYTSRVAFVVPDGASWPLPLYELALMLAERAFEMNVTVELHLVTPEATPLRTFGAEASSEVTRMLEDAGIVLHAGARAERFEHGRIQLAPGGEVIDALRVVTLPRLVGRRFPGLPSDRDGFLVTDPHGRVIGVPDVYAAGDITACPVKQGGLACRQADAAADHIAARAGASIEPQPFRPVVHGILLTQRSARFMRSEAGLEARVAGRELAGYLEGIDEAYVDVRGLPDDRTTGRSDAVDVVSLH